jgi:hypothetical protein
MWPSIRHWLGSRMPNPFAARGPRCQALSYAWERAGLVVAHQPVAWSAESVTVDALLRLPASARNKADFIARINEQSVVADLLRPAEAGGCHRAVFRFPPPAATSAIEVRFRDRPVGRLTIPVLSRADFLAQLLLETPTVYVRLGGEAVACRAFVARQCGGLLASAVLHSPAGLVPLLDLDVEVEFRREGAKTARRASIRLSASQLQTTSALLSVASPRVPRRIGEYAVTWRVGGLEMARHRIRAISGAAFERSLRLVDTRFFVQEAGGAVRLLRQPPAGGAARLGPCFLVASAESGIAGTCRFTVTAHASGPDHPSLLLEQQVLLTDGPAMVAPGTLDATDLANVSGFELHAGEGSLGLLPLCPAPAATFTAEGGFSPPPDYAWTPAADEEMQDRLNRLLGE